MWKTPSSSSHWIPGSLRQGIAETAPVDIERFLQRGCPVNIIVDCKARPHIRLVEIKLAMQPERSGIAAQIVALLSRAAAIVTGRTDQKIHIRIAQDAVQRMKSLILQFPVPESIAIKNADQFRGFHRLLRTGGKHGNTVGNGIAGEHPVVDDRRAFGQ